jgi:tetratricopeptide (TPR) repeat protein
MIQTVYADDIEKTPLKLEISFTEKEILPLLPIPAIVKITNISDKEVAFLPTSVSSGSLMRYTVTSIENGGVGYIPKSDKKSRIHFFPLGITNAYDITKIQPGKSIERTLEPEIDHYFGFLPGKYLLKVGYTVTKETVGEMYQEAWHRTVSSECEFIVIQPKGIELEAYNKFKDVPPLNDYRSPDRDIKKAVKKLESVVKLYPNTPYSKYSQYLLASCYHELDEYEKAIKILEPVVSKLAGTPYYDFAQRKLLSCYEKNGNSDKAINLLNEMDIPKKIKERMAAHICKPEEINKSNEHKSEKNSKEFEKNSKSREIDRFLIHFPDAEKKKGPVEYKVKTNDGDFILFKGELMDVGEILWVKMDYPNKEFLEKHKQENTVKKIIKLTDTEGRVLIATITWQKEKNKEGSFGEPFVEIKPEIDPGDVKTITYSLPTEDGKKVNIEIEFVIRR